MKFIYVKYFARYLIINLFKAKQHGYLALTDDIPQIIPITEEHHRKTLTYDEYIHEIKIADEITLNELIVEVYNDKNLNEDEKFELDKYTDLYHQ